MSLPQLLILGGGPAGLGAAYRLRSKQRAAVTLLEKNDRVGGNAGSFDLSGIPVDYGSHRLHPACDPEVLRDIRSLLGEDLLLRSRHGRIQLRGRWIHFPLKPLDLAVRLPPDFIFGTVKDTAVKILNLQSNHRENESFASVLEQGLGETICEEFYFPYARKIWGLNPEEISPVQAQRRVSANSLARMVGKVLTAVPGVGGRQSGTFYYPKGGYGQISSAYASAAEGLGAEIHLAAEVVSVEPRRNGWRVIVDGPKGGQQDFEADYLWSTIPITLLARMMVPGPPTSLLKAVNQLDYRAMVLVYLVLDQDRYTEYDAHYFPEIRIPITRLSEPKNYSGHGPEGRTVLCAEIPCSPEEQVWGRTEEGLREVVTRSLDLAGLPDPGHIREVHVRRLRFAYPIYRRGYERIFDPLDDWMRTQPRLLSFGRQGLFAHDNTHHALYMAYSAVECLTAEGVFELARWREYRKEFEEHVVVD